MIRLKINFSLVLVLSLFVTGAVFSQAKSVSNSGSVGNLYVPANGVISIFGQHSFASGGTGIMPGIIATAKGVDNGIVNFAAGSSWAGANDNQFIDGYVRVTSNNSFVMPIGSNGQFKPVMITGGTNIEAAYIDDNPQNFAGENTEITLRSPEATANVSFLSNAGYWHIKSDAPTKLTLFWNQDDVSYLDGNLSLMSMYGWNGESWVEISAHVDEYMINTNNSNGNFSNQLSTTNSGSLTTTESIDLNDYEYFTMGRTNDVDLTAAMVELNASVFPNPVLAGAEIQIDYEFSNDKGGKINLINPESKSVIATQLVDNQKGSVKFNPGAMAPGVYLIGIFDEENNSNYSKLIVVSK